MSETSAYILNPVQTPASIETVYRSIQRGNTTKQEIIEDTALDNNLLDQGLTGLQVIGLIGRQEPVYYTVDLPWQTGDERLDFRMGVLHNLAADAEGPDWGKQSVVLLNYQYLLQEERQLFESDESILYNEMNKWHRERGYSPRSQEGEIDLNREKFVNWTRLAEMLGLVYKASGRTHTTYPEPSMIYESIRLAIEDEGADGQITITDYISWLHENLLLVELTSDGNIPSPLARILFNLVRDGQIRIVERGDAGAVGLNGVPRREGIDKEANSVEVIS